MFRQVAGVFPCFSALLVFVRFACAFFRRIPPGTGLVGGPGLAEDLAPV